MSSCNYTAPNGQRSLLYEGLFALLGPRAAHLGWYKVQALGANTLPKDINGDVTLTAALQYLKLGTPGQAAQAIKFATRWKLVPLHSSITQFKATKKLARTMNEHLKSGPSELYKGIIVRYNAVDGILEIIPKPVTVHQRVADSKSVTEYTEADRKAQEALKVTRDAALAARSKPLIELPFINDGTVLDTVIEQEVQVEDTNEVMLRDIKVGKWQAQIKKEYVILNKLVNCI